MRGCAVVVGDGEGVVVGPEVNPPDRHLARLEAAGAKMRFYIYLNKEVEPTPLMKRKTVIDVND